MKVLLIIFIITFTTSKCEDDDGQYHPDPNNDGRYIPDNSGQYVPDYTGTYRSDGSGGYTNSQSGQYKDNSDKYRQVESFNVGKYQTDQGGVNLLAKETQTKQALTLFGGKNVEETGKSKNLNNFGNTASATINVGNYRNEGQYDGRWKILRQLSDYDTEGYHWEYETENGINAEESGRLANKGTNEEAMRAQGFYEYTGPDNVKYYIKYTADENGFVAVGNHLPTPPPIPEAILQSLEYHRSLRKV